MKNPEFDWGDKFDSFLDGLPDDDEVKLLKIIENIEDKGLKVAQRLEWIKKLDTNLYEIRSKFGSNIQRGIYFQLQDNHYWITHGFTKKTQRTPKNEIAKGKKLREEKLKEDENE
ncbi:MAG: type II toxin-antitoxin system RelE/ParE family toxin [Streptococcaceae bacterium]|jgi:phage-related protein|nr:type II toxin-antitoxin system RelE/ParE family toxin [Streptococcaceae bacterium]